MGRLFVRAGRRDSIARRSRPASFGGRAVESLESRTLLSVWFVATTGADQGPGTLSAPFRTIQRAADAAEPGDTILIHAGTYRETVTPPRSGSAGEPITFEAFGDGPVVISGADPVAGWTLRSGSVYSAPVGWNLGAGDNQVFFDGQPIGEARWPASSSDLADPPEAHAASITSTLVDGAGASTAVLHDPSLTQPAGFWVGATIRIAPGQGWAYQVGTVTASAPGQLTYSFTSDPATRSYEIPGAGDPYSLTGVAGALAGPGEWFVSSAGVLSLWSPAGDSPAGHDVEVKHRLYAFNLSGVSYVDVVGVSLLADTIATDSASSHLTLANLNAEYLSQFAGVPDAWAASDVSGIAIFGSSNKLIDSTLAYSAGNGVLLAGQDNVVQGCVISGMDQSGANFAGITTEGAGERVLDNVIYDCARDGIRISTSPGIAVLNNVVHDVMLQDTDGGGIYTWGTDGTAAEIGYNQVYDVTAAGFGGAGIYLDNNDSNWLVDHNVVWNCTLAIKLNPVNTDDTIEDDVLANSDYSVGSSGSEAMPGVVFSGDLFTNPLQLGPGAIERNDTTGSFTAPANPEPDAAMAAAHGSFTPPPGNGPALAADAVTVQSDRSRLAQDLAAQHATTAADKSAARQAVAAATVALAVDAKDRRAALLADVGALAANRRRDAATWAQTLAADRRAIAAARAAGAAKVKSDSAGWSAQIAQDSRKLKADAATFAAAAR